jgi:anthranilate/para-aminobenzoate synthase component I
MIVDLVRNDVGRVCTPGSVDRNPLLLAEAHPSVWHLVGDVHGQLAQGRDAFDLLRACFPPGSCIGAPKVRAMGILEQLEHSRRGPYTGAIGWVGLDSTMCLSVAIRTLVFRGAQVSYGVGGGIVYDSNAKDEWKEALLKGKALAAALLPEEPSSEPSTHAREHVPGRTVPLTSP